MGETAIEWTAGDDGTPGSTWNPIRGCSRTIAKGAKQSGCGDGTGGGCYAERTAGRFCGPGQPYEGLVRITTKGARWTGKVKLVEEHLDDPIRWQRPRRIFVNSMSDLFHEDLDDSAIDQVFAVMLLAPHHTYMVLTKRAARMRAYFETKDLYTRILNAADVFRHKRPKLNQIGISNPATNPARWIWLGVSVENQSAADERIPDLLATPAAVRWLSCEPLLSDLYLTPYLAGISTRGTINPDGTLSERRVDPLSWVVSGCESGPGSRPCDVSWLRSLRDQCIAAGVPYFVKQAVGTGPFYAGAHGQGIGEGPGSKRKPGGVIGAPYLDGRQWLEFPASP